MDDTVVEPLPHDSKTQSREAHVSEQVVARKKAQDRSLDPGVDLAKRPEKISPPPQNEDDAGGYLVKHKGFDFPLLIFAIASLASVAAVIGAVYRFPSLTLSQYRILLLLLCFSASTVSALVLKANAKLDIVNWKTTTMVLGGPAVLWIMAAMIFSVFLKEESLVRQDPMTTQLLVEILRSKEIDDGWLSHSDWQNRIGGLRGIIEHDETHHFESLVGYTHFEGQGYRKVSEPEMPVTFIYFDDFILKFQRLKGKNPGQARVFSKATTTDSSGAPQAVFLCKNEKSIIQSDGQATGQWFTLNSSPIDCLTVAIYENEKLVYQYGDILPIAITKYINSGEQLKLKLAVLATKPIKSNAMLWHMKRFQFMRSDQLPILFRNIGPPSFGTESGDLTALKQELTPWLLLIDKCLKTECKNMKFEVREFLDKAVKKAQKTLGEDIPYAKLLNHSKLKNAFYFSANDLSAPVAATFEWDE